jgi:ribosomal protein S18 acetylase RimI-like enzyme
MNCLIISPVQIEDLPEIKQIDQRAFGDDAFGDDGINFCFESHVQFQKVTLNKFPEILAFSIIADYLQLPEIKEIFEIKGRTGKFAHLMNFCVHEQYRHQGIGSFLIHDNLDRLKQKGYTLAYLEVQAHNIGAKTFYEKQGFKKQKLIEHYYQSGDSTFLMERPL